MWGKKDKKAGTAAVSGSTTLIAEGTDVQGDIRFRGVMHVEGRIVGDIRGHEGTLRLVDGGVVEGDIYAPHVIINGEVKGNVHATEHLELANKAHITGSVYYQLIEMAMGAQVNGSLEHKAGLETIEEPRAITAPEDEGISRNEKITEAELVN